MDNKSTPFGIHSEYTHFVLSFLPPLSSKIVVVFLNGKVLEESRFCKKSCAFYLFLFMVQNCFRMSKQREFTQNGKKAVIMKIAMISLSDISVIKKKSQDIGSFSNKSGSGRSDGPPQLTEKDGKVVERIVKKSPEKTAGGQMRI